MYETTFKNIDDTLRKDAGCSSELDYIEQTSWVLFLKYLDDYEKEKKEKAELDGKAYTPILKGQFTWKKWAAPKRRDGKLDYNAALTGDDLIAFTNMKLFPHLAQFKRQAKSPNATQYKIGEIFSELRNKLQSGYNLREIINKIDGLKFLSNEDKHELSSLYEDKIKNMGNAGRNGGEYYTPRPLIRAMARLINPKVGERVYDGALGSAGFLCEAYAYMRAKETSSKSLILLQTKTFFGREKKSLAYIIGIMNMILHGIEAPNITHTNTLTENIMNIQNKDRVDVVLTNPPFGGKERPEVQQNFPIKSSETAYLFLQHFIKILKKGGRCGIVIKNTFLSNTDNASIALRKQLLEDCELFGILDMPQGSFLGTGVKTVVLFFQKGKSTKDIWYYQLDPERSLGKTNPLNEEDLSDFLRKQAKKSISKNSWRVNVKDIDSKTCDLSVRNPNVPKGAPLKHPQEILSQMRLLDQESQTVFQSIKELL